MTPAKEESRLPSDPATRPEPIRDVAAGGATSAATGLASSPWSLLVAGLLAALVAWGAITALYPPIAKVSPPPTANPEPPTPTQLAQDRHAAFINSAFGLGAAAAAMACLFALCEALFRRSVLYAILGLTVVVLFAGSLGALGAVAGEALLERIRSVQSLIPMAKGLIVNAVAWLLAGAGVGFAFSLPAWNGRTLLRTTAGAAIGGLLGVLVYAVASAFVFPLAKTDQVVPEETGIRLFWLTVLASAIGVAVGGVGRPTRSRRTQ